MPWGQPSESLFAQALDIGCLVGEQLFVYSQCCRIRRSTRSWNPFLRPAPAHFSQLHSARPLSSPVRGSGIHGALLSYLRERTLFLSTDSCLDLQSLLSCPSPSSSALQTDLSSACLSQEATSGSTGPWRISSGPVVVVGGSPSGSAQTLGEREGCFLFWKGGMGGPVVREAGT